MIRKTFCILAFCTFNTLLYGENVTVEIPYYGTEVPYQVIGVVFGPDGSKSVKNVSLRDSNSGQIISFSTNAPSSGEYFASALVVTEAGETKPTSTVRIDQNMAVFRYWNLPECKEQPSVNNLHNQIGLLNNLARIREERAKNRRLELSRILSPEVLKQLQDLETGFWIFIKKSN